MKWGISFVLSCSFVQISFATNLTESFDKAVEEARLAVMQKIVANEKTSHGLGCTLRIAAGQGDEKVVMIVLQKKTLIAQNEIDAAIAEAQLHGHTDIVELLKDS